MSVLVRKIEVLRGCWGAALLFAPRRMLTTVYDAPIDRADLVVGRILGARHLTQAVLSGVAPSPEVLAMGVWVDAAHGASAAGLAVVNRSLARAGVIDTIVASTWAAAGHHDLEHAAATAPAHDRRRDAMARAVLGVVPGGGPLLRAVRNARDAKP